MPSKGIRSNGVVLRHQDTLPADVAVYEFDLDYERWHANKMPGTGRQGAWRGVSAPFTSSVSSDFRPWNLFFRFGSWDHEHDRSFTIQISRPVPKRRSRPVPKRRSHVDVASEKKPEDEDGEGEKALTDAVAADENPAPGVPPSSPSSSTGTASSATPASSDDMDLTTASHLHPFLTPPGLSGLHDHTGYGAEAKQKPKVDFDDDLRCEPYRRNAALIYVRLFSQSYDKDKAAAWKLIESSIKTKDSLRELESGLEGLEMRLTRGQLGQCPTTSGKDSKGTPARWLRLEITTIFNHDTSKTLAAWPSFSPAMQIYDQVVGALSS
ncbi:hypothetical protein JCM10213_001693 [Rhodosporidiobolus nylandii]